MIESDAITGEVRCVINLPAPPEAVMNALMESDQLEVWCRADGEYCTTDWNFDVVRGRWSCICVLPERARLIVRGELTDWNPDRALAYAWEPQWENYRPSRVAFGLTSIADGTRLTLTHGGFEDRAEVGAAYARRWRRAIEQLRGYLTSRARR